MYKNAHQGNLSWEYYMYHYQRKCIIEFGKHSKIYKFAVDFLSINFKCCLK